MLISTNILHQIWAITPVTLGNFMIGTIFGWLAPTLQTYKNSEDEFSLTENDCSWMVSLQYMGRLLGCVLTAVLVDKIGRTPIITLAAIFVTLSWIGTALTRAVRLHYAIRLVAGMSIGMTNIMTPMYVGETSSPHVRGVFGSISLIFFFGGQLAGCALATYCRYEIVTAILGAISLASLASVVLLREPAQYLLTKGRETEAERRFWWTRGNGDGDEQAKKEFNEMRAKLTPAAAPDNKVGKFSFAFLLDRRVQIVCAVNSLSFLTGFPAMSTLVAIALSPAEGFTPNELTILFELAQLIGAIVSPVIIDRYNRRTLWMVATTLSMGAHAVTSALYYTREIGVEMRAYAWLLFASITAYSTIFSTLIYGLSTTARGEFLPQKYKAAGSCTSLLLNSMFGSLLGHVFLKVAASFGMKMNFIIFGAFSFVLQIFCYFCVPETRGMSLVEIERYFEKPKAENKVEN